MAQGSNTIDPPASGGGSGTVTNVSSPDTSLVVTNPTTTPSIKLATADVIFTNEPPAAAVPFNNKKGTGVANGTAASDIAAFGQIPLPSLQLKVLTDTTALPTTGFPVDGKLIYCIPAALDGRSLSAIAAYLTTAQSGGSIVTIQVRNITKGVDMLSTPLTIDNTELTTYTAATPPVIDTTGAPAHNLVNTGDLIAVDIDQAAASPGTPGKGLGVILTF